LHLDLLLLSVDKGTRGPLFPAFDVAERNDDHALAASAFQFDATCHKLRQEIAARTAALLWEWFRVLDHGSMPQGNGEVSFIPELQIAIVLII
jgi:hypothetical protein